MVFGADQKISVHTLLCLILILFSSSFKRQIFLKSRVTKSTLLWWTWNVHTIPHSSFIYTTCSKCSSIVCHLVKSRNSMPHGQVKMVGRTPPAEPLHPHPRSIKTLDSVGWVTLTSKLKGVDVYKRQAACSYYFPVHESDFFRFDCFMYSNKATVSTAACDLWDSIIT